MQPWHYQYREFCSYRYSYGRDADYPHRPAGAADRHCFSSACEDDAALRSCYAVRGRGDGSVHVDSPRTPFGLYDCQRIPPERRHYCSGTANLFRQADSDRRNRQNSEQQPALVARSGALKTSGALGRRCRRKAARWSNEWLRLLRVGDVEVDFREGWVRKAGESISLAGKETQLLRYLIDHRGNVVSRDELLEAVWAYQPGVSSRTIDVHVAWLRQKLEDNPGNPRHIHTVRGVGYRFAV